MYDQEKYLRSLRGGVPKELLETPKDGVELELNYVL